ncbi:hypothetical protein EPA93_12255 [Ktedonosporobacter rubrisoli]|uniref:Uncharacterized protein n=1 Tax=Ktedonosporobacter rubrisoli TaxID=2509675 RepID=A0A4P6JNC9_KTERU|nr:hypothetical protein [Ktedonosporobacter rubrisoli]QBD76735.1 hypothetical protein EPA93_12255 [Ktedonosporobacter rubrisoli]
MSLDLSPAYFDLQLHFAASVAQVSHFSFEEAIFHFTNIYLQCLNRSFEPTHANWQAYLAGLQQAPNPAQYTFAFYEKHRQATSSSPYGCFQYIYLPAEQAIRFHFTPADGSGYGPLSRERRTARLLELKSMFTHIKQQRPEAQRVRGCSWLYNLEAYKRLFPPQYTDSMVSVDEEFQFLSLWGQFLQRDGQVRSALAQKFLAACCRELTLEGLLNCFPYRVLAPTCAISAFYEFYAGLSL